MEQLEKVLNGLTPIQQFNYIRGYLDAIVFFTGFVEGDIAEFLIGKQKEIRENHPEINVNLVDNQIA